MTDSAAPFRIITIMPLLTDHRREIAGDLRRLRRTCGVTDVAFCLSLHPETPTPDLAKAEILRDRFVAMRAALKGADLNVGILIQSTLGHGTISESGFARSVNANGATTASMCPLAPGLKDHLRQAVAIVASTRPAFLLVDDDFRLANHGAAGCYCDRHLAEFARVTGRTFSREALLGAIQEDALLRKQWDDVRLESLLALAREIRAAIDVTDPKLPCGFCVCDAGGMELQFARPIVDVLAGGNPPFVRVNSAWYWSSDPKSLLGRIYWTAAQTRHLRDIPEVLAESDTYPQNRHCTSARALHAQIVFSVLHGCTGLKLWVDRMFEYQPESGQAYRKMLKANIGLYQSLRGLMRHVAWDGPATPLPADPAAVPSCTHPARGSNWAVSILGRMGIPVTVGADPGQSVVMLSGRECDLFSDDEITSFLGGGRGLLLDGAAAVQLCRRGFGPLLGVDAECPPDWKCSFERMGEAPLNGSAAGQTIAIATLSAGSAVRLTPKGAGTVVLSTLCRSPFRFSPEVTEVGAGLTLCENRQGGRVAVFAAVIGETAFMDEARHEQLLQVLGWLQRAPLPVAVITDTDVYALHGRIAEAAGGGELLALFGLHMDPLDKVRLRLGGAAPVTMEALSGDGLWKALSWKAGPGADVTVKVRLESVVPLVLRIRRRS